ncbi:hypothetical protein J8N05_03905 [Streptomyces sp. BH-SS-21]|uniref:Uncharacterized protein n=1 Tax=Streptomyces liliiviolaceus TaxID=2823109 RepID=A0A940XJV7_9ACTN|nr:hypothetical protein [Streptomyces liliiviolaceus]MBQ0847369.1 hypothetical protein [Streptomyces liliiviolaceus]
MPWEELNRRLSDLKAQVQRTEPYWLVEWRQDSFSAHPAFLDSNRASDDFAAMVGGDVNILHKKRVVTNGSLAQQMQPVYKALGGNAAQYTDVSDKIRLLRHWDGATKMGVFLGAQEILQDAGAFAVEQKPATCADFVHAQAAYLAVGQSLPPNTYVSGHDQSELLTRYRVALEAAGMARPLHIGDASVWAAHSLPFAETLKQQSGKLTFGSPQAVVEHALKHLPHNAGDLSGEAGEQRIRSLVDGYLTEATAKIRNTDAAAVTSALDQCAGSRTYYFGAGAEVAMVAVSRTGLAWISTYYAPGRS